MHSLMWYYACIPFVNLNNNNMLQFLVTGACV